MKKRSTFTVLAKLIVLIRPLLGYMLLAIILGLIGNLFATFITLSGAFAIGKVLGKLSFSLPLLYVSIVLLAVLRAVLRYGEQSMNHFIAFKLLAEIRDQVFKALRRLAPAKLEGRDKGDLISVITSDIELLEVFYAHTISPICIAVLYCTFMCIFFSKFNKTVMLVALCAYIMVGFIVPMAVNALSGNDGRIFRDASGELSSFVLDSLRGLREVLQYHQGEKRLADTDEATERLSTYEWNMKKKAGYNASFTHIVILAFDLAMVYFAATTLETYQAVICVIAMMSSFGPVSALAALGSTLQNTVAAGNRVLDILEEEPITKDINGKEETVFDAIHVEDLSFSYDADEVLSNLTLEIPKNHIVGISGKSGSGKSTLLKLIMRFWESSKGSIKIGSTSVNDINTVNLRNMESYVTQDTHLFHDTLRNNIRIAKLDATDEEIERACQKASVDEFIHTLPDGYDTVISELGENLSSGEKQRIGLARSFLHDSDVILLDEPTSNLDSLNEAIILKSLKEEKENKTIVLVSHRASTMRIVDEQYAVENGRLS